VWRLPGAKKWPDRDGCASGAVSPEWLGLVLLAVVGNAAEHVTAVFVAYRNKVCPPASSSSRTFGG
jgi:hypothetical protein